jgi:hypothetical protein
VAAEGGVAHGNLGDRPSGGAPTRWWGLGLLALALVVFPLALYLPTGSGLPRTPESRSLRRLRPPVVLGRYARNSTGWSGPG